VHATSVHGIDQARSPDGIILEPIVWGSTFLTSTWITH